MARVPIEMPNLGFDVTEGRLVGWLKQVGDRVERGEAVAEIETEKATVELEALDAGMLVEIARAAGETVEVGAPVAYLESGE